MARQVVAGGRWQADVVINLFSHQFLRIKIPVHSGGVSQGFKVESRKSKVESKVGRKSKAVILFLRPKESRFCSALSI